MCVLLAIIGIKYSLSGIAEIYVWTITMEVVRATVIIDADR
jgi:hypothetical protein